MICQQKYMTYMLGKEYKKDRGKAHTCHKQLQWQNAENKPFKYMSFDEWLEKNNLTDIIEKQDNQNTIFGPPRDECDLT